MIRQMKNRRHLTSFQIIILGFSAVILTGALLLMLPISSQQRIMTPFSDALFTSTSAVCVTGLVVKDTASYWSYFGQAVILLLIQTGGLGVVTVAASIALVSGRKISLMQRSTIREAIAAPKMGGIVRLTGFIIKMTLTTELAGALIMMPVFIKDYGLRGIWMAVFHSVSAFCNAGFDIMGTAEKPFTSLTSYVGHPVINTVIMLLIITGGIGFLTWDDIRANRFCFKKYRMQSKVILTATGILIFVAAAYFFFAEFSSLPFSQRLLARIRVTVRRLTAGQSGASNDSVFVNGKLRIDYAAGCAYIDNEELHLTPIEYKLLCLMSRNVGKVLTHTFITGKVWGSSWDNDVASLRVFMTTLRKKLEAAPDSPKYIQTHIGVGYRMLKVE